MFYQAERQQQELTGKTITTINPATKETIANYDLMSKGTAVDKVEACHAAFLQWKKKTHEERAPCLRGIAGALRDNAGDFAKTAARGEQVSYTGC